jgi:type IV secretion system protein VirB1
MSTLLLSALLAACAPQVHAATASALIAVESAGNPHAIGVVVGALVRQPANRQEAIATARALQAQGWNFSVGLAQINLHNLDRLGLTLETAFDPCLNLRAMQAVLNECFESGNASRAEAARLRDALSCYYSGNFATGYRHGYVRKVVLASSAMPSFPNHKERS